MEGIKTHILPLFLPLVIGNVAHMIIVKKNYIKALSIPISSKLFGTNKTYRGFLVLPVLSGFIAYLNAIIFDSLQIANRYALFIRIGLGFAYMLFELPNSYLKRKLGIPQGTSSNKYKILQLCIDKIDSLVGVLGMPGKVFSTWPPNNITPHPTGHFGSALTSYSFC